jgi:ligand-binding SRPBCC domain-containing protein
MSYHFRAEQWVPVPIEKVFRFFADPGNLPRLMPPWMDVELLQVNIVPPPGMEPITATVTDRAPLAGVGSELVASYRAIPLLPFRITSVALITEFVMHQYFADVQKEGPFRMWHHRHQFATTIRNGVNGTVLQDIVEYEVGYGVLGVVAQKFFVGPQMRRTFAHRQRTLEKLLT